MTDTRDTLEKVQQDTDAALDFIEHEVGANRFAHNWKNVVKAEDPIAKVQRWLAATGTRGDAAAIVNIINELAAKNTTWLTPYTSPIPAKI